MREVGTSGDTGTMETKPSSPLLALTTTLLVAQLFIALAGVVLGAGCILFGLVAMASSNLAGLWIYLGLFLAGLVAPTLWLSKTALAWVTDDPARGGCYAMLASGWMLLVVLFVGLFFLPVWLAALPCLALFVLAACLAWQSAPGSPA